MDDDKNARSFLSKNGNTLIGIAGLVITAIKAIGGSDTFTTALVFTFLYLTLILQNYQINISQVNKYKYEDTLSDYNELSKDFDDLNDDYNTTLNTVNDLRAQIKEMSKQVIDKNVRLAIDDLNKCINKILINFQQYNASSIGLDENALKQLRGRYIEVQGKIMWEFLLKVVSYLKVDIDKIIVLYSSKPNDDKCGVCIKELTKIFNTADDIESDLKTFSVCRDSSSLSKGRSITDDYVPVLGNTDFMECLRRSRASVSLYTENHIEQGINVGRVSIEPKDGYKGVYNAHAVYPVFTRLYNNKRYYGFIAVDSLNMDDIELFNKEDILEIMQIYAYLISIAYYFREYSII